MEILGKKVKDLITGLEGIATSKHIYLTGCNQYGVQPPVGKDGKIPEMGYFDEGRIKVLGPAFDVKEVQGEKPGCDFREHPKK